MGGGKVKRQEKVHILTGGTIQGYRAEKDGGVTPIRNPVTYCGLDASKRRYLIKDDLQTRNLVEEQEPGAVCGNCWRIWTVVNG